MCTRYILPVQYPVPFVRITLPAWRFWVPSICTFSPRNDMSTDFVDGIIRSVRRTSRWASASNGYQPPRQISTSSRLPMIIQYEFQLKYVQTEQELRNVYHSVHTNLESEVTSEASDSRRHDENSFNSWFSTRNPIVISQIFANLAGGKNDSGWRSIMWQVELMRASRLSAQSNFETVNIPVSYKMTSFCNQNDNGIGIRQK